MTDINIRLATVADVEALAPLFDLYRVFYKRESDLVLAERFIRERLENAESVILLAEQDRVLGFAQLYPLFSSTRAVRKWLLNDLYVLAEARRSGIGRALLQSVKDYARESGYASVELSTAVDNLNAQALYESMGFVRDTDFFHYACSL